MTDTAVTRPGSAQSPRDLAARFGLHPAGQRPKMIAYIRQLWAYRHFIGAFANARLIAAFTTAHLGRLWQVLTPLSNAAIYYVIFGVVLNARAGVPNFIAYLCTGLFVFTFTQTVVLSGSQAISSNLGLIRALQFPRASLPIAATLTQFQQLVASIAVLIGIVLITGEPITMKWLLLVPALLLQSFFNAGLALAMARMGAKVADLKQILPFVMRTWMYASGVLYSVENFAKHLPSPLAMLMEMNPLLVYIELARYALLENVPLASSPTLLWLLGAGWALLFAVGGFIYFWRGEQEYGRG